MRAFDPYIKRERTVLNGFWRFATDAADCGIAEGWHLGLPRAETVSVPSVWNTQMGLLTYEGVAYYQREFYTDGGTLCFRFGGVMTEATVWLDDMLLGSHYGGFCQFELIARDVCAGTHRLTVRADNRFDEHSIPQKRVDWYHYGGICRDVEVERLQGICTLDAHLEYVLNPDRTAADYRFAMTLYNADAREITAPLALTLGGEPVYAGNVTLAAGETLEWHSPMLRLNAPHLWDPEDPYLYTMAVETDTDGLLDRVGFRSVEVKPEGVCINGRRVELLGVNRHEEHPDWGFAFPVGLMKRDLDIVRDMGCNTLRGSHYPNSRVFMDMLDERGMLFWSEIPIWGCGFSQEALGDPVVVERGLAMHREMVKHYYNHPSIIIWGMHNEIRSDTPEALEMSRIYYDYLKTNGGNRIVTYASNRPMDDICMKYADLICLNVYHGWYGGGEKESWDGFVEDFRSRRKALGLEHVPVVMSEFGAAGLYGHHTFDNIPWTEEYQAELIAYCLELFHRDPMMCGTYVWQFCDIRTCRRQGLDRARGFNNKGLVNEYRKPKAAYHAVRRLYREFAKKG